MSEMQNLRYLILMHGYRVQLISTIIADKLNLLKTQLNDLRIAAYYHDIGKLYIKDNTLLFKTKNLTQKEFEIIKEHSTLSYINMKNLGYTEKQALIAHDHHEHLDGTGYPNGKKNKDIAIETRIITVADIFDALTTDRVYRSAYSINDALDIMSTEMKNKIDANIFIHLFDAIKAGELKLLLEESKKAINS